MAGGVDCAGAAKKKWNVVAVAAADEDENVDVVVAAVAAAASLPFVSGNKIVC